MSWHDDIDELAAEQRVALRFWETPEEQASIHSRSTEDE